MDIVFLDANVLFSAAYRPDSHLAKLCRLADTKLITSAYAVDEARRNLRKPEHRAALESLMAGIVIVAESMGPPREAVYPEVAAKDQPILRAAVAARATHLVTGDTRHFGPFYGKTLAEVTILPPARYLQLRAENPPG